MIKFKQKNAPFSVQKYPFLKFLKKLKVSNINGKEVLFIAGRKIRPLATNKGHHINAEEKAIREQAEEMASDGFKSLDITPPDHLDKLANLGKK